MHQGELFAAVHYTGGTGAVKPGAIYAIDIKTGNRRVISGSYQDPKTGRVDVGSGHTVEGEALLFLVDIELGKDGKIEAFGSDTLNHVMVIRVDIATGARELVWRRQSDAFAGDADFPYGQCWSGRVNNAYAGGYAPVQHAERAFVLGEDGSFYIGWKNDGVGVTSVSADGNNAQGLFQIGMGMPVLKGKYPAVQGAKGALDNNNHNGYGAVGMDPYDGNILYFVVLSGVIKYEIDTGNSHFLSM